MLLRVLKRKCGWSCIFSVSSRAVTSLVASCDALSSRSRERLAYVTAHVAPTIAQNVTRCVGKDRGSSEPSAASWVATMHGKPISRGYAS